MIILLLLLCFSFVLFFWKFSSSFHSGLTKSHATLSTLVTSTGVRLRLEAWHQEAAEAAGHIRGRRNVASQDPDKFANSQDPNLYACVMIQVPSCFASKRAQDLQWSSMLVTEDLEQRLVCQRMESQAVSKCWGQKTRKKTVCVKAGTWKELKVSDWTLNDNNERLEFDFGFGKFGTCS